MPQFTPSSPLRVLVVDDLPDLTHSMAALMRMWGHDVRIAHDGPEALDVAAGYDPHVVLLDVSLPSMDGYQVARCMRSNPALRRAFLVSITGYGEEADAERSREAGCDCHLLKPIHPRILERLLASRKEAAVSDIRGAVEDRLRHHPYLTLRRVACEYHNGTLTLRGCLPTYYLKQIAQEAVAEIKGVERIENEIEVGSSVSTHPD